MPYGTSYKKRTKKYSSPKGKGRRAYKKFAKYAKKYSRSTVFNLLKQVVPYSRTTTHSYFTTVSLNSGSGIPATHVFRANGMYDPDYTGGGHQAIWRDQMAALYNHYEVIGSRIKCTYYYANDETDGALAIGAIILDDDGNFGAASLGTMIEAGKKFMKYKHMSLNQGNSHVLKTVRNTFSERKFFGKVNNDQQGSAVGSDPTDEAFYIVAVGPPDGSTELPPVTVTVKIDYLVKWTEPKDPTAS